jgi:predicted DsbA family dithiol-disulfide isomerase
VSWVHFPLHPETPPEGRPLASLFPGRDIAAMNLRMQRLMEAEGLPYGHRTHTYNSRLAQELGAWADQQPGFDAIHLALFQAYFVQARNIGDVEVLVDIARSVGMPAEDARAVLTARRLAGVVDADWKRARASDVTGVPTFICGDSRVVGAQPYEVLEQLVRQAGASRRAP